jgi:hypothetical protein
VAGRPRAFCSLPHRRSSCAALQDTDETDDEQNVLNIGDAGAQFLLGLARTPLVFYPHYRFHLPLPTVLMVENTNHCNADCVMCPRELLS